MSKELEALERLYCAGRLDLDYVLDGKQNQDYKIVETALKEYEFMKQTKIIVSDKKISDDDLEKLKNQRIIVGNLEQSKIEPLFDNETQNKLKALEIIKEKRVNVEEFIEMFEDWKEITYEEWIIYYEENGYYIQGNEDFDYNRLAKEEFDFLKEVLL